LKTKEQNLLLAFVQIDYSKIIGAFSRNIKVHASAYRKHFLPHSCSVFVRGFKLAVTVWPSTLVQPNSHLDVCGIPLFFLLFSPFHWSCMWWITFCT